MYRASFMALMRFWSPPSHNIEVINTYVVTSDVIVVKYGGGSLLMFHDPTNRCYSKKKNIFQKH